MVSTFGNDTISGLGDLDTILDGLENHVCCVNNINYKIIKATGDGIVAVQSSISYAIGAFVEI